MTESDMYWLLKMDDIRDLLGIIAWICGIITFFALICALSSVDKDVENDKKLKKEGKPQDSNSGMMVCGVFILFFLATIAFTVGSKMTPTTKEAAAIKVVPKIVNSEFVNEKVPEEADEILQLAKDLAKDLLKEKVKEEIK